VGRHFETQFSDESAAKKPANELQSDYPIQQIEIYNSTAKTERCETAISADVSVGATMHSRFEPEISDGAATRP
jgi:hypothetical protein